MHTRSSRSGVRRILWILAAVAMIMAVMPLAGASADEVTDPMVVDLVVDGGTDSTTWVNIGVVEVWDDGTNLHIKYVVNVGSWCLTATQVDIGEFVEDLATTKKGLPKIGKFEFKAEHDCVTEYELPAIDMADLPDTFAIAAHADTLQVSGLAGVEMALPATADLKVKYPGPDSYFSALVTNGGVLDGTYTSWCVDVQRHITPGRTYTLDVFSSYEDLPTGTVDYPENMDLVNWLINNLNIGVEILVDDDGDPLTPDVSLGLVTKYDVANVIWKLIDNTPFTWGGSSARVPVMFEAAMASGEGFEPGCDEKVAIIMATSSVSLQSTIVQTTFLELGIPCEDREETGWAGNWNTDDDDGPGVFEHKFVQDATWAGYLVYAKNVIPD